MAFEGPQQTAAFAPAFKLHLSDPVTPGLACVGKFDGQHSSLAYATVGGKVCIHSPHSSQAQVQYLNINKEITALAAGQLDPALGRDVLLIGTATNLHAYDLEKNQDVFFKEVSDGVTAIVVGHFGHATGTAVIVGGNCSVQGFDAQGNEQFWTVTGDIVSAMALCAMDQAGKHLLVGSDDFDIRHFQNEEVVSEITEADKVVALGGLNDNRYCYALANGTIGVYAGAERIWRVKSKHSVAAVCTHDMDSDGTPEVISGWSNGRVEVRKASSGNVVFKDTLAAPVAAIIKGDYRGDGTTQIIVCSTQGEVRGYLPIDASAAPAQDDTAAQQAELAALTQRKQ